MKNITILINTSDGFEDCWDPFFKLFTTYWPDCKYPILLNTEFKEFSYRGLNIKSAKSNSANHERRLTWSECLINALNQVDTPFVLYMQEDYFIDHKVNGHFIEELSQLMISKKEIAFIGLTDAGNYPPFKSSIIDSRLWTVSQKGKYRVSTQAGIWKKEILLSYLLPEENGWMFEIFGTKRAQKRNELFLTVNRDLFNYRSNPVISYLLTGIIKAKWHEEMPRIFMQNGIEMDFNERGFYKEKPFLIRKIETARKLLKLPSKFIKGIRGI